MIDERLSRARRHLQTAGDPAKQVRIRVNNLQKAVEEMLIYLERERA